MFQVPDELYDDCAEKPELPSASDSRLLGKSIGANVDDVNQNQNEASQAKVHHGMDVPSDTREKERKALSDENILQYDVPLYDGENILGV